MRTRTLATLTVVSACIALLALLSSAGSVAQGAAPATGTVPYSGQLSDDLGQPVADGAYAFRFALYDDAQGGNLLWSETQSGVAVKGGVFTTQLGNVAALPEAARAKSVWLAVSVRGPDETAFTALSPRQSLDVAVASAPSSPAASAACAHDHFGESWSGSTTVYGTAFEVENKVGGGTGIKGIANIGFGVKYGVYGESLDDNGVYGNTDSGFGVYGNSAQNGKGVVGYSNTGVGVLASSNSGPAILIDGGISVEGAGIDSDTPVFIHKVNTATNICSGSIIQLYSTVIDNPFTNNQPNAILIVTPNFGANNVGVAPAVGIPAVYYDATNQCGKGTGKWVIYNLNTVAQVNNSMFNVMVVH
jgi:hypothetical protein